MNKKDFSFSLAAALITSGFLYPTLQITGIYKKLPIPLVLLFLAFPVISILGMYIFSILSKKLSLLWQFAKFAQIGVLNTAVDFGILNILISYTHVTSGLGIIFINATSFTVALVNSYFWNKSWVFGGTKRSNFVTFVVVTLIGLLVNTGVVYGLTTFVPPVIVSSQALWANVAKLLATGLSLIWNFVGYKLVVFKSAPSLKKS